MANINILVVDDEQVMRSLFTDILQDEGYKVVAVSDGKQAQERAKAESFDLVFIDVHMPVMDGIKTLHALRRISPSLVIVMMDSMPSYMLKGFKQEGAITCIHKPFNISEVRSVVKEIISKG
jgi:DNA-binding response OmpR family regulator